MWNEDQKLDSLRPGSREMEEGGRWEGQNFQQLKKVQRLEEEEVPNVQWITPDDGQRNCRKRVEFRTRINLEISTSVGFIINKFITMHGHMNLK